MKTKRPASFMRWENKWGKCKLCPLHLGVKNHVLYRGDVPAELLFLGEAPGKVEDTLGKPFVGPSGVVLNNTVARLGITSFGVANIVCCIPLHREYGEMPGDQYHPTETIRRPSREEADACSPHLVELINILEPKLIVCLGNTAKEGMGALFLQRKNSPAIVYLRHPAFVLRRGGIDSAEHKKLILGLQEACATHNIDHVPYFTQESFTKSVETN